METVVIDWLRTILADQFNFSLFLGLVIFGAHLVVRTAVMAMGLTHQVKHAIIEIVGAGKNFGSRAAEPQRG